MRLKPKFGMDVGDVAGVCHEVNRVYCVTLGDHSQSSWGEAPDWQRQSARDGVKAILDAPDTTPEQSHENWLAHKEADGWKYGPVKDAEKKEHPCFVPYADLPASQQIKDDLFGAVVRALCVPD